MSQCCSADDFVLQDGTRSGDTAYMQIMEHIIELAQLSYRFLIDYLYMWFVWLVGDIAGLDPDLILEYIALLWYPIVCFLVFPLVILILLYASALFLTVYKWKNQLHEAYHHNFWDGARQTLAVFWEAQASVWHGYDVVGLDRIPDKGPALLIYYHGAIPLDMYYLIAKIYLYKGRLIHPIGDRFLFYIPGFQTLMKVFQVQPGTRESCTKLLQDGHIVAISPGGVREAIFSHNYELLWNKRQGFAKVALDSKAPIIPVFTRNTRQAINTLSYGQKFFRNIYEKTRWPLAIYYGLFPVKLRSYIGEPIETSQSKLSAEELSIKVRKSLETLIATHQRNSTSILLALLERFIHR